MCVGLLLVTFVWIFFFCFFLFMLFWFIFFSIFIIVFNNWGWTDAYCCSMLLCDVCGEEYYAHWRIVHIIMVVWVISKVFPSDKWQCMRTTQKLHIQKHSVIALVCLSVSIVLYAALYWRWLLARAASGQTVSETKIDMNANALTHSTYIRTTYTRHGGHHGWQNAPERHNAPHKLSTVNRKA